VGGVTIAVVLDGFHAVKHALRFGADIERLVTTDRAAALELARALAPDIAERLDAELVEVSEAEVARLVGRPRHPTGVAGLAARPAPTPLGALPRPAPVIALDRPRHAGNLGAAVRVAAGMGAAAVVSTGTLDPWNPTVLRGSAGLHFALPVQQVADIAQLPDRPLLAFDAGGTDLRAAAIPPGAVLLFGSERHGVEPELRARADAVLALPMRPLVSSYNLATAVAMALYHWSLRDHPPVTG
jgi:TrmH family RNA methyltransferase